MKKKDNEGAKEPIAVVDGNSMKDNGMAIAGITVGVIALAICLWRFNWFTFLVSIVGGIFVSSVACMSQKQNNVMVIISIICSTVALIVGLINYPDVLDPIINCMQIAAWVVKLVKQVWSEWASSMQGFLYFW